MARRTNYAFERNQRARAKAAKREAKREQRAEARAARRGDTQTEDEVAGPAEATDRERKPDPGAEDR